VVALAETGALDFEETGIALKLGDDGTDK